MSSRFSGRVRRIVCICARLSIWKQPTVSARWISANTSGSSSGTRERSIRSPRVPRDQVDALLDRRQHPEPEQVDLEEAGVGARVLVPLAHLPALHRRRLHRHELDERPRGDDHPARVLGDVARQAGDLGAERGERAPARRARASSPRRGARRSRRATRCAFQPSVSRASRSRSAYGRPSALPTSRIAPRERYVAKARDERGVLVAVALDDADDELLADVAREVEVDVRHRRELAVEEAAEREVVRDRVDVREAGQVADERADRGAAPAAGRQRRAASSRGRAPRARPRARARAPPSGAGRSRRGRARRSARAPPRAAGARAACGRSGWSSARRTRLADAAQLDDRRLRAVGEVGIAVAELLRQVELEPLGELGGVRDGVQVVSEAVEHLLRRQRGRIRGCLAAPARSPRARCGSERRRARPGGRPDDGRARARPPSRPCGRRAIGEVAQVRVAARVAALVRALQLDVEAVASEGAREPCRRVRVADREPVARTAGEADESLVQLLEQRLVERGGNGSRFAVRRACARARRSAAGRGSRSRARSRRGA